MICPAMDPRAVVVLLVQIQANRISTSVSVDLGVRSFSQAWWFLKYSNSELKKGRRQHCDVLSM